jgi:peptidoglycan/LPS O-acetylase OafA/YrhL
MRFLRRINWLLIGVYWLLMMGMIGLTVYLTDETSTPETIASGFFFGMMGGIAYAFYRMGEGRGWKWLGVAQWSVAALALFVYVMDSNYVNEGLAISALFFLAAGVLMFFGYRKKSQQDAAAQIEAQQQEWRALGTGVERDWYSMSDEERAEVIARDKPTQ